MTTPTVSGTPTSMPATTLSVGPSVTSSAATLGSNPSGNENQMERGGQLIVLAILFLLTLAFSIFSVVILFYNGNFIGNWNHLTTFESVHEPVNHEPVKEGSGGGCSYNDDEDCYSDDYTYYENYYYEGSGSGDGSDEDSLKTNEGSKNKPDPRNRENEADNDEENWLPWVTAKPVEENKINDIEMVDEANNPVIKPKPRKPSFNRSSPNLSGSVLSVTCATLLALYFAVKSH